MRRLFFALVVAAAPALAQTPAKKTQLQLDVKPAHVVIYVDDKRVGKAGKVRTVSVTPGRHRVKLVRDIVSHEERVSVKSGETKVWVFQLGADDPKKEEVALDESETATGGSGLEEPAP